MGYYADSVSSITLTEFGRQSRVTAVSTAPCVQLYLGSSLLGSADVVAGKVSFFIAATGPLDVLFLLGVDSDSASLNYFDAAFPLASSQGNRIEITTILLPGYLPTDKLRVYRGAEGAVSATEMVSEEAAYASVDECGGWGTSWGTDWGFGSYGAGWGSGWGYQWGFDAPTVKYISESLPCGTYPVKVTVVDAAGNESTATTASVTVASIPRPASDLTIVSYTSGTDTLALSWTASPDL